MTVVVRGSVPRILRRFNRNLPFLISDFAEDSADELVRHIRVFTPVKTGELWRSIEPLPVEHRPGSRRWHTGAKSEVEYASFVEDGTLPHPIEAHGQALRFFYRGVPRYAPRIELHPGTPAHKMFAKGAFTFERTVRRRFELPFRVWKVEHRL